MVYAGRQAPFRLGWKKKNLKTSGIRKGQVIPSTEKGIEASKVEKIEILISLSIAAFIIYLFLRTFKLTAVDLYAQDNIFKVHIVYFIEIYI